MHLFESARPRSVAVILLIVASTSSACTRSVLVAPEDVPTLVIERSRSGSEPIRVTTLDGEEEELPRDFDNLRVIPPEDCVFMSPPGQPDTAVPVARELRNEHRKGGWKLASASFAEPFHAEVDSHQLYVAGRPGRRERAAHRTTDRPLAYRAEDVRGVAVEVPDSLGTTGTILGVTAGVAVVAAIVAGIVVVSSMDMGGMSFGNPMN